MKKVILAFLLLSASFSFVCAQEDVDCSLNPDHPACQSADTTSTDTTTLDDIPSSDMGTTDMGTVTAPTDSSDDSDSDSSF